MIWLFDFLIAVMVALLFGWLVYSFVPTGGDTNENENGLDYMWLLFLFLLLLLPTWGGGIWLVPIGPAIFGVQVLNFLLMGLFVALIVGTLLAATNSPPPTQTADGVRLPREAILAQQQRRAWNQFFWILAILMLMSLFFGYWWF